MKNNVEEFYNRLKDTIPQELEANISQNSNDLTIKTNAKSLHMLILFLKNESNFNFKILTDLFVVDYPSNEKRFEVNYNLLSIKQNKRLIVRIDVEEGELVPSICNIFNAANWYEREAWDMYGVFFTDHPDLRRILTDYGFSGHPLRKDFPLSGYVEVRYDDDNKQVVYEPVKLDQEFRNFDFESPWEGTQYYIEKDK